MVICLCIGKDDINTHPLGNNFIVETKEGISLSFTP